MKIHPLGALVLVLGAGLVAGASPAAAAAGASYTCHGLPATIVGTSGKDVLTGTSGPDVIVGLGGNDRIDGGAGDDVICGGYGADRLDGGPGNDRLYGGLDHAGYSRSGPFLKGDTLRGGPGDDLLSPGYDRRPNDASEWSDVVTYDTAPGPVTVDLGAGTADGDGHDRIVGTKGFLLEGSPYDDTITGSDGPDIISGMAGNDLISARGGNDDVMPEDPYAAHPPADNDAVLLGSGDDTVYSYAGRDTLVGDKGNDQIVDYSHEPGQLLGGPGRDSITTYLTTEVGLLVSGGPGTQDGLTLYDLLSGTQRGSAVIDERSDLMTMTVGSASAQAPLHQIERYTLTGQNTDYQFQGTAQPDRITDYTMTHLRAFTRGGDDTVYSLGPHDYLDLGSGIDTVHASVGATCLHWERGSCGPA